MEFWGWIAAKGYDKGSNAEKKNYSKNMFRLRERGTTDCWWWWRSRGTWWRGRRQERRRSWVRGGWRRRRRCTCLWRRVRRWGSRWSVKARERGCGAAWEHEEMKVVMSREGFGGSKMGCACCRKKSIWSDFWSPLNMNLDSSRVWTSSRAISDPELERERESFKVKSSTTLDYLCYKKITQTLKFL